MKTKKKAQFSTKKQTNNKKTTLTFKWHVLYIPTLIYIDLSSIKTEWNVFQVLHDMTYVWKKGKRAVFYFISLFTVNMSSVIVSWLFISPSEYHFYKKHDVLWHWNKFFCNVARLRKMNTENIKATGISEWRRMYLEITKICPLWPHWEVLGFNSMVYKCEYANNVHILNTLSGFDHHRNKCGLNTHFECDVCTFFIYRHILYLQAYYKSQRCNISVIYE